MEKRLLGKSGIEVSKLCYGTLTFCGSQANLSPEEGGELLLYAASKGVNFIDTAELYGTYAHVAYAIKHSKTPLVISTKSYAYDRKGAKESLEKARREMNLDVIDIFMMHEQETVMTMLGHMQALEYYLEMKTKGIIRAVGISTHAIEPVQAVFQAKAFGNKLPHKEQFNKLDININHIAEIETNKISLLNDTKTITNSDSNADYKLLDLDNINNININNININNINNNNINFNFNNINSSNNINNSGSSNNSNNWKAHWCEFEPRLYKEIDVIHPILNFSGIGLLDGTSKQMENAVREAHKVGVGIFGMKMFGGGNLFNDFEKATKYALNLDCADAYAVGMQSKMEIDMNIALFENRKVDQKLINQTRSRKRRLLVEEWCTGCGACVKECKAGAMSVSLDGKAMVNKDICVLCSYCARACRDFAIKVV